MVFGGDVHLENGLKYHTETMGTHHYTLSFGFINRAATRVLSGLERVQ